LLESLNLEEALEICKWASRARVRG